LISTAIFPALGAAGLVYGLYLIGMAHTGRFASVEMDAEAIGLMFVGMVGCMASLFLAAAPWLW
jgi:hypothetical protein